MTTVIETSALAKSFGRTTALHPLDLSVDAGSVFGIIGPNGAGKTTLMRLLLDILRPTSGNATVLGQLPRAGGPALRRQIGFLPGELRLEGRVTGRNLLRHFADISGPVAPKSIDMLADRLNLDLSRTVRTLSKGNKQKLGLVQAFMHEPRLLVLDEPTSGLDPLVQQEFLALVREAKQNGQTVFLSSHVLSEIQQAADSVAILRAGHLVSVSDVESLRVSALRRVRVGIAGSTVAAVRGALSVLPILADLKVSDGGVSDGDVSARGDGALVRVAATVEGDIDPFVKAIARFHIADLAVEEPDLEESVLRLYSTPEAPHAR